MAADDQQAALRQVALSRTALRACVCVHECAEAPFSEFTNRVALSCPTPHGFTQLTQSSLPPNTHTDRASSVGPK